MEIKCWYRWGCIDVCPLMVVIIDPQLLYVSTEYLLSLIEHHREVGNDDAPVLRSVMDVAYYPHGSR